MASDGRDPEQPPKADAERDPRREPQRDSLRGAQPASLRAPQLASELAARLDGSLEGVDRPVHGLAEPNAAGPDAVAVLLPGSGTAVWDGGAAVLVVGADADVPALATSRSEAALQDAAPQDADPAGTAGPPSTGPGAAGPTLIRVDDARLALATLSAIFDTRPHPVAPGVHASAVVADGVELEPDVRIGPHVSIGAACVIGAGSAIASNVSIGAGCRIGAGCTLHPGVHLYDGVILGDRVVIHAGSVIGADGFGYAASPSGARKVHQLGTVEIGDDVEIGANTCIDRGTLSATRVGPRSKIDNHCQVGHNVHIGADCVIAGMSGISGSTRIGDRVTIGGYVAVADHLAIGDDVRIAGRSGVTKDVPAGETWAGFPAQPYRGWVRSLYLKGKLERVWQAVKGMEAERE